MSDANRNASSRFPEIVSEEQKFREHLRKVLEEENIYGLENELKFGTTPSKNQFCFVTTFMDGIYYVRMIVDTNKICSWIVDHNGKNICLPVCPCEYVYSKQEFHSFEEARQTVAEKHQKYQNGTLKFADDEKTMYSNY
uniref:Uncharacterized protein n=1 Tax=Panagrolaimus sp. ES5 TaxID=591445 RepID=A0AC34GV32_9BILA